jgi:hypothetical protein
MQGDRRLGECRNLRRGVDGAGKPTEYWQSLRNFWRAYFQNARADLRTYTVLRDLPAALDAERWLIRNWSTVVNRRHNGAVRDRPRYFDPLFTAAQRFLCAAAIRARASALSVRFFGFVAVAFFARLFFLMPRPLLLLANNVRAWYSFAISASIVASMDLWSIFVIPPLISFYKVDSETLYPFQVFHTEWEVRGI